MAKVLIFSDEAYKRMSNAAAYMAAMIIDAKFDDTGLLKVKVEKNAFKASGEEATADHAAYLLGAQVVHVLQVEQAEKKT